MQDSSSSKVFIIEDDHAMGASLRVLVQSIGFSPALYPTAEAFLDSTNGREQGCALVDIRMPGMSGIELIEKMRERGDTLPVIVLTAFADVPTAVNAIQLGAIEFLQKPAIPEVLCNRIREAIALDDRLRGPRERRLDYQQRFDLLSARELEVLEMVVNGKSSKQIASALMITSKTVDKHRTSIMRKLSATNATELVRIFIEMKMMQSVSINDTP